MPKYNRKILAVMSDTHAGHTLGLCNPETKLQYDDGTEYPIELTASQKYLWGVYSNGVQEISKLAGKDEIVLLHLGDITHGMKYISEQSSTRIADQFIIAQYNMLPFMELSQIKNVRIDKGTASHVFGEGSSEIIVERLLRASYPKKIIKTLYHGLFDIDGFLIDSSHHGPYPGSRKWLEGNEARYYLRSLMMSELALGNRPPHLTLRGHYHTFIKEYLSMSWQGNEYESWLFILPALCMLGDYGRQATRSAFIVSNGMVAFEIINGRLHQSHKFIQTTDIRTKETL